MDRRGGSIRRVLLRVLCVLMLLCAPPMALWCLHWAPLAALDADFAYAGVGCLAAGVVYLLSMVTAIVGLVYAGRPARYGRCRVLAYIQLAAGLALVFPLGLYAVFVLPPLMLLSVLTLCCAGWRAQRQGKTAARGAQGYGQTQGREEQE